MRPRGCSRGRSARPATIRLPARIGICAVACLACVLIAASGASGRSSHARRHHTSGPSRCHPRAGHRPPKRCRHADGAPKLKRPPPRPKQGLTGGAAPPDQYLPWANGVRHALSQGNLSPCGWSHAPPSCQGYLGYYTQYGWDFLLRYGEGVHATVQGRVLTALTGCRGTGSWGCHSGYGNTVTIETPYGDCERYEHLSAVYVHAGQPVNRYDVIGATGSSGNSTGTHLHYQREICFGRTAGYAIPSAFIEAGVPRTGQTVTSRNHPGSGPAQAPSYQIYGAPSGVDVESAPTTKATTVGHLANGASVMIACQTNSGAAVGGSPIWDELAGGGYVPDYYVDTPAVGTFSPGLPQCSTPAPPAPPGPQPGPAGAPSLDGGAHDTSFEHVDPWGTLNGGTQQNDVCGDGTAFDGSCFLDVSASAAPGNTFVEDFNASPTPGQCYTMSAYLRSRTAPTFSLVLAIWVRNLQSDQSASTPVTVGKSWTYVTVTMRVPTPKSGPPWYKLRGQLYMDTPNQLLDWDLTRWWGPYGC